jgi:hypothetical protein
MAERFVARTSRARVVLLVLGSILFVAASLWIVGAFGAPPKPGKEWIGWVGAPLFALLGAGWAMRLRGPADQIVIDRDGLTCRSWSDEHIPWSSIRGIDEYSIQRQTLFGVHLADSKAHPPTRLLGKVAAAQSGFGRGDFTLLTNGTDKGPDDLREALGFYRPG